ncbi:hypothetical protein DFJ74DRAFT_86767 [Hyaloraphidium curvatum]|nr:hypothetical protein DFJ74DRAFT_86767 [Hyaloraphidium curvatum]
MLEMELSASQPAGTPTEPLIPAGDRLATLGPADFLAVFPRPPAPDARVPRDLLLPTADPALPARLARPLTPDSMLDSLKRFPFQRAQLALQFAVIKLTRGYTRPWLYHLIYMSVLLASGILIIPFNDGTFSARHLAVGTLAFLVNGYGWTLIHFVSGGWRPTANGAGTALDGHWAADLVRWAQLVDASRVSEGEPELEKATEDCLLRHDPDDPLCPCPRKECAGGIPEKNAHYAWTLKIVVGFCGPLGAWVLLGLWTICVTFSPRTWTTPRAAFLLAFTTLSAVIHAFVMTCISNGTYVPHDFDISNRLRRRLLSFALSDLVKRLEARWHLDCIPAVAPAVEPYTWLHPWLTSDWRVHRTVSDSIRKVFAFGILLEVVTLMINILGASCVPAWTIAGLSLVCYGLLANLCAVAVQNHHIDGTAALYLAAADRISLLLLRPAPPGTDRTLVWSHAAALRTYADPSRYRARFLGFVVTFGALRTLLLAAFTVVVGLVGLLRGGGVTVTLQSVCPG